MAGGAASAPVADLVEGVFHDMLIHRIKVTALAVLSFGLFGVGTVLALHFALPPKAPAAVEVAAEAAVPKPEMAVVEPLDDPLPPAAITRLGVSRFHHDNLIDHLDCTAVTNVSGE